MMHTISQHLVSRQPDQLFGAYTGHLLRALREISKPQIRIEFPEPVRRDLGKVFEPLFLSHDEVVRLLGLEMGDAPVSHGRSDDHDEDQRDQQGSMISQP